MASSSSVQSIFETILQRPADPGEIVSFLDSGVTDLAVAQAIALSPAALAEPSAVIRLYEAVFGRKPDIDGFNYWVDRLTSEPGFTIYKMAQTFIASKEFTDRYGVTNLDSTGSKQALIEAIYKNVLARAPDAEGLNFWMGTNLSPAQLLVLFSQSKEFIDRAAPEIQRFFIDIAIDGGSDPSKSDVDDYLGSIFDKPTPLTNVETGPTNGPPLVKDLSVETSEDSPFEAKVPAAVDAENDPVTYKIVGKIPDGLTFKDNGLFIYQPTAEDQALGANQSRKVTFQYVANDGISDSAPATVTITVKGENDAPVARDVQVLGTEDDLSISGRVQATDAEGDKLTYKLVEKAPDGLTFNDDGTFTYIPQLKDQAMGGAAFPAWGYSILYVANDGSTDSLFAATLRIQVVGVNDAPVASDVSVMGTEDDASIAGKVQATDAEGNSLTYNLVGDAPAGLKFNSDGTFSLTPSAEDQALNTGQSRVIKFDYKANDGTVDSNKATVTITIAGMNEIKEPTAFTGIGDPEDVNVVETKDVGLLTIYSLGPESNVFTSTTGDDIIYGSAGNDSINAGQGTDEIYGGSGNDTIIGGDENDNIIGGYGADQLTGGSGDDSYIYNDPKDTNDIITDFSVNDKIVFDSFDADTNTPGLQKFIVKIEPVSTPKLEANSITWIKTGNNAVTVYGDTDGNLETVELMIKVTGVDNLTAGNFSVI